MERILYSVYDPITYLFMMHRYFEDWEEVLENATTIVLQNPNAWTKPKFDVAGQFWFESATAQEIEERNTMLIDALSADYRGRINAIVLPYLPDLVIDGTPIPANILGQRLALKAECDLLIKEIDTTKSMSKPSQVKTPNAK